MSNWLSKSSPFNGDVFLVTNVLISGATDPWLRVISGCSPVRSIRWNRALSRLVASSKVSSDAVTSYWRSSGLIRRTRSHLREEGTRFWVSLISRKSLAISGGVNPIWSMQQYFASNLEYLCAHSLCCPSIIKNEILGGISSSALLVFTCATSVARTIELGNVLCWS